MSKSSKKTKPIDFIKPLFELVNTSNTMGQVLLEFTDDNYNKELGSSLIDAKDDASAIASFLNEYKDSPETLRFMLKK